MNKRVKLVIIFVLIIFGGTFFYDVFRHFMIKQFFARFEPPAANVSTAKAVAKPWYPTLTAAGSLVAVNGVELNSQVNGQILKILFESGQMVTMGQPLIQLDDAIDRQVLIDNQAQLTLDKLNYERLSAVYKRNAVALSEVDTARARMLRSEAAVETAKLNIFYKNIKAPFSGKIGIRKVNVGQYITAGQDLVSLQSLTPLYIDFSLAEQDLPKIRDAKTVELTVDTFPKERFTGKIIALDSRVDVNTRTIGVRALIENGNQKLYPGLYAHVTVWLPAQQNVLVIPQTAISYNLYGDLVYVLSPVKNGKNKKDKEKRIVHQRFVKVGERRNNEVQILSGLKAGEEVITVGQLKLHEGSQVVVNNSVKL